MSSDTRNSLHLLPPPMFSYGLRLVSEAAARAAFEEIGRGDRARGDIAAVAAMRSQLVQLSIHGMVVIGDVLREESPGLSNGEEVGADGEPPLFDIAVDPIEGTSYLERGMTNAMSVIAVAPRGAMFDPRPAFYMEKFAGPPAVKGKIDPMAPVAVKLSEMSRLLNKPVSDLTVYVLEKPRHRELVDQIHRAGARVAQYPAGDVAGGVMASIPDSGIDAMMGTGGTPEGILCACAIRALGGEFMGRLDPQLATEKRAVEAAELDTKHWHGVEDLVRSDQVFFCATGITTGLMLAGVERTRHYEKTQTMIISGPSGERQVLTTYHPRVGA